MKSKAQRFAEAQAVLRPKLKTETIYGRKFDIGVTNKGDFYLDGVECSTEEAIKIAMWILLTFVPQESSND